MSSPSLGLVRYSAPARTFAFWALATVSLLRPSSLPLAADRAHPVVVEINLDDMVQPVSAEYVTRGIRHANEIQASAILLKLDTPGGFERSMKEIIQAILESRVPAIAYLTPRGGCAASAPPPDGRIKKSKIPKYRHEFLVND